MPICTILYYIKLTITRTWYYHLVANFKWNTHSLTSLCLSSDFFLFISTPSPPLFFTFVAFKESFRFLQSVSGAYMPKPATRFALHSIVHNKPLFFASLFCLSYSIHSYSMASKNYHCYLPNTHTNKNEMTESKRVKAKYALQIQLSVCFVSECVMFKLTCMHGKKTRSHFIFSMLMLGIVRIVSFCYGFFSLRSCTLSN